MRTDATSDDAPVNDRQPSSGGVPAAGTDLVLRGRRFTAAHPAVMAVVNLTPDSFYAAARFDDVGADRAVEQAVAAGADLVDVGGVRAGRGPRVDVAQEIARVIPLIQRVRNSHPELLVSVDTWRSEVARAAIEAGADLINDTWAGHDPELVQVAASCGVGVVCSHTGGLPPRSDPFRVSYPLPEDAPAGTDPRDGVLLDVLNTLAIAAARAVSLGIPAESVLVDPTHDFGKNTWHSLHLLRNTAALTGLGHPVLVALSRKDFVGETLDLPPEERLEGTLAATALAAWFGARVFRTHDVRATRRTVDLIATVRGDRPPARVIRALA